MNPLDGYIQEGLLSKKNHGRALADEKKLEDLKEYSYNSRGTNYQKQSPWEIGKVELGPKGIEVELSQTRGYMRIDWIPSAERPVFDISKFVGELHILNNGIETLEGMFTSDCEYTGNLYVYDNGFLESLAGVPKNIHGQFIFRENKNNIVRSEKELEKLILSLPQCKEISIGIIRTEDARIRYNKELIQEMIRKVTRAMHVDLELSVTSDAEWKIARLQKILRNIHGRDPLSR